MKRDVAHIQAKLSAYLPGGDRIVSVKPMTTGFSNETYLLEGLDLVLRLPSAAGAMLEGHGVIAQAKIYQELRHTLGAPPVPNVVVICEDSAVLGAPFYVMERVEGESVHDTNLQSWFIEAPDVFRTALSQEWIASFASLAKLAPLKTLGNVVAPEDDARMWRAFAQSANCRELVDYFDRLLAVPAPRSGPPAIIHGDTKLSNLMWRDGRVSAVLDWEMALNGEPLADLGYVLYGFESKHHRAATPHAHPGMIKREDVIALWSHVSARSAEGVAWHEIAQLGKVNAIIAEGKNQFDTGRSSDPKFAVFEKSLAYYLQAMKAMLDERGL